MRKRYKVWLVIIVILLVITLLIGVTKVLFKKDNKIKIMNSTNVILNIEDFGYSLDDRDTEYMKEEFETLKKVLSADEIDYKEYASCLAKLFVIDFYTLNNKINKYDVGGLEYILSSKKEEFLNKAMDTIYKDIIDNTYQDRVQKLPEIKEVTVDDVLEEEITLNGENVNAYKVEMRYEYVVDLGYDQKGVLYLTLDNGKLVIVKYTPGE